MKGAAAVAEVLAGIQRAFEEAARRKLGVVRRLAALHPPEELAGAHRAMLEALMRSMAADADPAATDEERRERVTGEAAAAREAVERIRASDDPERFADRVTPLLEELRAADREALDACDRLARGLGAHTTPEVAGAVAGYVAALRAVFDPDAGDGAFASLATAQTRLERTLASG